jgi:hypothetical protein
MVSTGRQWQDQLGARSGTERVLQDAADLALLARDEVPDWLTRLRVPVGWCTAHLDGSAHRPWRIAVCGQRSDGGWDGCETIAAFSFTGFPAIDAIQRDSQRALRQFEVGPVDTASLAIPPAEGAHAVRSSGQCRTAGRQIWAQYSFYVVGSASPNDGLLVQQGIFAEASRLAALEGDLVRLSNSLHMGFVRAIQSLLQ